MTQRRRGSRRRATVPIELMPLRYQIRDVPRIGPYCFMCPFERRSRGVGGRKDLGHHLRGDLGRDSCS
jgi:hypothetical protein